MIQIPLVVGTGSQDRNKREAASQARIEQPKPTGEYALRTVAYLLQVCESIETLRTHAYECAPVSNAQATFPVLVFSPGFGISRSFYTILYGKLTSHGYIVAPIDHPYLNLVVMPDGRWVNPENGFWHTFPAAGAASSYQEAERLLAFAFDYLGADHLFVLDQLAELNRSDTRHTFSGRLDLERVASLGHSAGALAPQGLILRETPIDAFVLYDVNVDREEAGPDIVVHVGGTITKPVLLARLEYAAAPQSGFGKQLRSVLYDLCVKDASHSSVTDLPYIFSALEGDPTGQAHVRRVYKTIHHYTLAFLDSYVKDPAHPVIEELAAHPDQAEMQILSGRA